MTPFDKLAAATLLAAAAFSPPAAAVYLDPDGMGQALIYPYYTARSAAGNPFNTYISVANTDGSAKALRVRFREGANGREVASFNLFLGPDDMWSAAVVPDGDGARLVSVDKSCVDPVMTQLPFLVSELAFRSDAYTGANADGLGETRDRTREGYVEILEMASIPPATDAAIAATPSDGVPEDCPFLRSPLILQDMRAPTGGLMGTLTLINVASGQDFTVNANALAGLASASYFRFPADPYPDFNAAEVRPSSAIVTGGKRYMLGWARGIDAVSSVMMQTATDNEFVIDTGSASLTDWVYTLPMRRFESAGCETISYRIHDRESYRRDYTPCTNFDFYTCPGPSPPPSICGSARAMTFDNFDTHIGKLLGSAGTTVAYTLEATQNGWARVTYSGSGAATSGLVSLPASSSTDLRTGAVVQGPFRVLGLPVLGFMARSFSNGTLSCAAQACQGNYGSAFPHQAVRTIVPAP